MSKTASEQIVEMFSKDFKSSLERQRHAAEHQRLKDAVVAAAKVWAFSSNSHDDMKLVSAIIELEDFESTKEQK